MVRRNHLNCRVGWHGGFFIKKNPCKCYCCTRLRREAYHHIFAHAIARPLTTVHGQGHRDNKIQARWWTTCDWAKTCARVERGPATTWGAFMALWQDLMTWKITELPRITNLYRYRIMCVFKDYIFIQQLHATRVKKSKSIRINLRPLMLSLCVYYTYNEDTKRSKLVNHASVNKTLGGRPKTRNTRDLTFSIVPDGRW